MIEFKETIYLPGGEVSEYKAAVESKTKLIAALKKTLPTLTNEDWYALSKNDCLEYVFGGFRRKIEILRTLEAAKDADEVECLLQEGH